MDAILSKAQAWAESKKIQEETILNARLTLDMFPFRRQIQIACDNAKATAARLSGKEIVKMEDTEKTFVELHERIQKTLELLAEFDINNFEGAEYRKIMMPYHPGKYMDGKDYLIEYALPNFYFHVTTAYDILRHYGLDLGKADYLGELNLKVAV